MKEFRSAISGVLTLGCVLIPSRAPAPPPMDVDWSKIPGKGEVSSITYWAAPYVQVLDATVYQRAKTEEFEDAIGYLGKTVTWHSESGPIVTRRVNQVHQGFAVAKEDDQNVVLGLAETWKLNLPSKANVGVSSCTPDSRTFMEPFERENGRIGVRLYLHGKLANTIGPFLSYRGERERLEDDGAVGLLIWKDEMKSVPQILLTDADGHLRAPIDCEEADGPMSVAPNGIGAVLRLSRAKHPPNNFTWYGLKGRGDTFEIGPNARVVGWIPDSAMSLFATPLGHAHRYQMIDWAAGKALWNIPCPGENGHPLAIAFTPKLVIFSVAELYQPGSWSGEGWVIEDGRREWIRSFHAVRVEDGTTVAKWRAQFPSRLNYDGRDRFVKIGAKLYYVTSQEFAEIVEDDIFAGRRRWER